MTSPVFLYLQNNNMTLKKEDIEKINQTVWDQTHNPRWTLKLGESMMTKGARDLAIRTNKQQQRIHYML
jgi:hypothetical protein